MIERITTKVFRGILTTCHERLTILPSFQMRQSRSSLGATLFGIGLGLGLFGLLMGGCAQSPVSGRPEVSLISAEKERQIGAQEAEKVEQVMGLVREPKIMTYVGAVGQRLAQHSPRRDVEYTFYVVDMVEPNAFALPGGYIYVSRGLLALVNSEDELAGVIGHEIAHVAARHSVQRVNVSVATAPVRIATGITGLATSIVAPRLGRMVAGVGQVASALVIAPYSRNQEREADRIGQEIAAHAGWDPGGITTFLDTLEREEKLHSGKERPNSFFATHPRTADRVDRTTKHAAMLSPVTAEPIAKDQADLLGRLEGLLVGKNPAGGVFIENRFFQPELDFTLNLPANWKAQNAPQFVAAQAPEGDALVLLQLIARGDDPVEVVRVLEKELKVRLLENAQLIQINGLKAVRSAAVVRGSEGTFGLDLTWVAHRGLVYQITGMSPTPRFESYRKVFSQTALSFRPPSSAERSQIHEARLRIVRARDGETLEQLINRVDGGWTPAEAAVANGIQQDARLQGDQLIKVPIRQTYRGPAGR